MLSLLLVVVVVADNGIGGRGGGGGGGQPPPPTVDDDDPLEPGFEFVLIGATTSGDERWEVGCADDGRVNGDDDTGNGGGSGSGGGTCSKREIRFRSFTLSIVVSTSVLTETFVMDDVGDPFILLLADELAAELANGGSESGPDVGAVANDDSDGVCADRRPDGGEGDDFDEDAPEDGTEVVDGLARTFEPAEALKLCKEFKYGFGANCDGDRGGPCGGRPRGCCLTDGGKGGVGIPGAYGDCWPIESIGGRIEGCIDGVCLCK